MGAEKKGGLAVTSALRIFRKDLALGPRSPLVLWALVLPVFFTIVLQGVFGSLFDPDPRLGIVDQGSSSIPALAEQTDGIALVMLDSVDELLVEVENNDLDAGLILQEGFDADVMAGNQPPLQFYVGGESLASNRIILSITTLDLIRQVAESEPAVAVDVVTIGAESLDLSVRLLPLMVIMAVAIGGAMIPAAGLVEEKEKRTLDALLVTPATMNDVLFAKGTLGFVLAVLTGVITLLLNGAFGSAPFAVVLAISIGAVMMAEVGLILGSWAPDTNTLFAAWKGGGIVLIFPVIFTIWPTLPQWIAELGPTYYFLQPVFDLSVNNATLGDVIGDLAIAAAVCVALLPLVRLAGRSLERRLATGKTSTKKETASDSELAGV